MSETTVPISLPLDDGFLRRECPSCERQFKWWASQPQEEGQEEHVVVEAYVCPYCFEAAPPDHWWTQEQVAYTKEVTSARVLGPLLEQTARRISSQNRPGSLVRFDAKVTTSQEPLPLVEPNDMERVDFPCHPEEPIKIDPMWTGNVACLLCGIQYPVDLVRTLPGQEHEA